MDESDLLSAIGGIYDSATDPAQLRRIGLQIARLVDSESALVFTARKPSATLVGLVSTTDNFDSAARADYRAYYHERNEWFLRGVKRPSPALLTGAEMIPYTDFDRTEFCSDWCGRVGIYHILAATVPTGDGTIGAVGLHRSRKAEAFSAEDKRVVSAIMPHLRRALQIAERLEIGARDSSLSLEVLHALGVGVVLCDAACRPLFVNAIAERLIRSMRWLVVSAGRLRPLHVGSGPAFERAVGEALATAVGAGRQSGAILRLRDPLESDLPVLVTPFRSMSLDPDREAASVAIIFADPDRERRLAEAALAAAYGLSPAESRLVAALAAGVTLPTYARRSGISINTAKVQLRSAFQKTGTNRQSDLVGRVLADPLLQVVGKPRR